MAGHCVSLKTWNSTMLQSVKAKRVDVVWKLYGDMLEYDVVGDVDTIGYLVQAFCMENNTAKCHKFLRQVLEAGHVSSNAVFNKLISAFCKSETSAAAVMPPEKLYKNMCERGYGEITVSYNTMISGMCLNGKSDEARVLFDQMTEKCIVPDIITYNSLIQGFSKEGKIPEGTCLLDQLLKEGLQPSTASYTILIEKLCEARNVGEAKAFWKDMVDRGVKPAASAYDSMILGLSEQENVAEGMQWLDTCLRAGSNHKRRLLRDLFNIYLRLIGWGCYVGDNGLAAVGRYFTRFEDLNMQFCEGLTDVGLDRLALGCGRTLKSLEVAASAKITDVSLEAVGSYCRSLETLSLESEFICNKGLLAVAKGCPLLISLELPCSKMTNEALQAITTFCPVLQFFSFCGSNYFTDNFLSELALRVFLEIEMRHAKLAWGASTCNLFI
ncbi:pentatricopeptide repeat-containing protein [Forsythia ovata]|uniref:Pentatricopeptide repeat-containing protein n=1 Tax=Forsythia ovata TaxID=205694 RepID=A0ABD1S0R4_9LAMI